MLRTFSFLFVSLAAVFADTIVLKDGNSVSGTWVGVDSSQVSILSQGQLRTYPRADVSTVMFGPIQATEAPTAQTPTKEAVAPLNTAGGKQAVAEPEYVGQFCLLDASGALSPLEHQTAGTESKARALGLGGVTTYYWYPGERSPVRIPENSEIAIVVRLTSRDFDPTTVIQFFRLTRKDGQRQLPMPQIGRSNGTEVPFSASKYGDKSFVLRPKASLSPGEYTVCLTTRQDGYAFGVDSAAK